MPTTEAENEVVKNVNFKDEKKKKKMSKVDEEALLDEELDKELDDYEDEDDDDDDDDDDDEEDDDDDEEEDDDEADGLTDIGLYNVLGNFMLDDDGNTVGVSLSNIAKELSKLNHTLKKYVNKN